MSDTTVIVATLWVAADRIAEYERYEVAVAPVMARHGGRIERAIRLKQSPGENAGPFEVHIVVFPSMSAFEAYRADPDTRALSGLRERAILRTEVQIGTDIPPWE